MQCAHPTESVLAAAKDCIASGEEDPFFVVDVGEAVGKLETWRKLLPRVEPFFAVKAHDDAELIKAFIANGASFDCASKSEIDMVLSLGGEAHRIVFANPCKPKSHIAFAREQGVRLMTFDNTDELYKIRDFFPEAQLLLRLLPDDSKAVCRLGTKFGASLESVPALLNLARELGLDVVGMAFHVGSGQPDASAFSDAVVLARKAFDVAEGLGFDNFSVLDIGGGFPGDAELTWDQKDDKIKFPQVAHELRRALDKHFPEESGIKLIAEPGRYMVHSACSLFVNIVAKRREVHSCKNSDDKCKGEGDAPNQDYEEATKAVDEETYRATAAENKAIRYFVNDGLYSSFNNILYDHACVQLCPVAWLSARTPGNKYVKVPSESPLIKASLWGPTCDGLDCIDPHVLHLPELAVGDWLYCPDMGAYTVAAASSFNGFPVTRKLYISK